MDGSKGLCPLAGIQGAEPLGGVSGRSPAPHHELGLGRGALHPDLVGSVVHGAADRNPCGRASRRHIRLARRPSETKTVDEGRADDNRRVHRVGRRLRTDRKWVDQFSRGNFRGAERLSTGVSTPPPRCATTASARRGKDHPQPGGRLSFSSPNLALEAPSRAMALLTKSNTFVTRFRPKLTGNMAVYFAIPLCGAQ